jgi:hypothetical protein
MYRNCPHQFHQVRVLKLYPFKTTPETEFGNEVHKHLEMAVGHGVPLPPAFHAYQWVVDLVMTMPGAKLVEQDLSVDKTGARVDKWDWGKKYMNGKGDVLAVAGDVAVVLDYKTGAKPRDADEQLDLMAMLTMLCMPEINTVKVAALYVQTGTLVPEQFRVVARDELPALTSRFVTEAQEIEACLVHGKWVKKPSGLCYGWCEVTTCENWKPRKVK